MAFAAGNFDRSIRSLSLPQKSGFKRRKNAASVPLGADRLAADLHASPQMRGRGLTPAGLPTRSNQGEFVIGNRPFA
jgi:hypothetical protein